MADPIMPKRIGGPAGPADPKNPAAVKPVKPGQSTGDATEKPRTAFSGKGKKPDSEQSLGPIAVKKKPLIVITHSVPITKQQLSKLRALGEVRMFEQKPDNHQDLEKRIAGAAYVITTNDILKPNYSIFKHAHVCCLATGSGWLKSDPAKLQEVAKNDVEISFCTGANAKAVTKWIIDRALELFGGAENMQYKSAMIFGHGNIGTLVEPELKKRGMEVRFYPRGADPRKFIQHYGPHLVVDVIGHNESTINFFNSQMFAAMAGSYYITVTSGAREFATTGGTQGHAGNLLDALTRREKPIFPASPTYRVTGVHDIEAMLDGVRAGLLLGAADDFGHIPTGAIAHPDYQRALIFKRVYPDRKFIITPHTSPDTPETHRAYLDLAIANIAAAEIGKPEHLATASRMRKPEEPEGEKGRNVNIRA